ncbi:MAG: UDP-3-O-(3-hydroxymyristoyl)glucosamine N-acyltransferase [Burkholderiales bacterium]|jgi:UDP-3-O-[3-hydroxymyristoyl] glucosamine N-acyltransferase|nr:UDP-3-O-(3-hydroxymyristoyl)glucosamine N-acyltransferase [Burkholderiales bacterium]
MKPEPVTVATKGVVAVRPWKLAALAEVIGATLEGDGNLDIRGAAPLDRAGAHDIAFLSDPKYRAHLETTQAAAVILSPREAAAWATPRARLLAANPYAAYAKAANCLYPEPLPPTGVHPTATVAATAQVAADAVIGPHATVGEQAIIGARSVIGAGCAVGDHVTIGNDVRLHPRVVIYSRCVVGDRCVLQSGCVIGADGFGFANEDGRWIKIPQIGRVVLHSDVEIGANTTIDRGALDDTVVEEGAKIDNLVQIGHNGVVGAHAIIAGCAGIAGSVNIGKYCRIGGAAMIGGHLSIADGAIVAAATPLFSSIESPGMYSGVYPVQPHRQWQKNAVQLRQLDTLYKRVRALEKALAGETPATEEHEED